jgi:hypothetical protein
MLMHQKVIESRATLKRLRKTQYLEHYARSTKYFKQKDEEIFVNYGKKYWLIREFWKKASGE